MANEKIKSFQDLIMWQKAKSFAIHIYKVTGNFPKEELYGITNQLRRAAISIPSNIAEGFRRRSQKDKIHFSRMAYGSGAEIETQLIIAQELDYLSDDEYMELQSELTEIMKMINVVINKL